MNSNLIKSKFLYNQRIHAMRKCNALLAAAWFVPSEGDERGDRGENKGASREVGEVNA